MSPVADNDANASGPEGRRTIVLVVDDETMVRNIVRLVLKRHGYEVLEAADGEAGIERFDASGDIDMVLSDILMPRLDGVGMVRALRERRPTLPVLFMSAYSGHQRLEVEGDDLRLLLSKPFTPDALMARVREVLANAR